jgi:mRNA-decapping enzyme subunit 2
MVSNITLEEVLDDLLSRFILNCPEEEYSSFQRLFFQIEEAHWFYLDFYVENNSHLPYYNLKDFSKLLFQYCPILQPYEFKVSEFLKDFLIYKRCVQVCGAVLINSQKDKILLAKSYLGNSWNFPRGKINKNEKEIDCAIREVSEEIGYDISNKIKESEYIVVKYGEQIVKLYIIHDVPESFPFKPQTRKEISQIQFFPLNQLKNDLSGNKKNILPLNKGRTTEILKKIKMFMKNSEKSTTNNLGHAQQQNNHLQQYSNQKSYNYQSDKNNSKKN